MFYEVLMLENIHHIAIICSDYDSAIKFYVDGLGLSVLSDTPRPEKNDRIIMLSLGERSDTQVELFIKSDAPVRPSYPEARGLRHLAFRVNDVEKLVSDLAQKGIDAEQIRRDSFTGEKMTFIHDPDGLPIELHE